ncbi:MAG TPA: hypothetical protein VJJ98_00040 [Sedimentisphaerales bacterium]|nr:hypothetical protein [Sedimentisphaerales bacterium]
MINQRFTKAVVCCMLVVLAVSSAQGAEQSPSPGSGRFGLYGDWDIKIKFGEREMSSILAFSRDQEGNLTGQSISFWGISELKDVKFEQGNLSFTQTNRFGENEFTSKFAGKIEQGNLTGTLTSDRGESAVEGKRSPRMPRAVGIWDVKSKMGEREFTSTLIIKADKEGKLTAEMKSERVEHTISDVQYEQGQLTFKRKTKMGDQEWESTFEGSIDRQTDTLSGVAKSDRGEGTLEGKRVGAALIGTWNLDIASEQGARKQRLKVNPDLSALYGAIPIKAVDLNGDKVSFKTVLEFGDQQFEMNFEGQIAEAKPAGEEGRTPDMKLTGEMKTPRGTSKITGKKVVRTFGRRTSSSTTQ